MQNTMSQPARSFRPSTIFAPSLARGSALARVRSHTAMSQPPLARRRAISKPMRPAPIQPIFAFLPELNSFSFVHFGEGSITASTVPTGTVLPASTRMAFTTPAVIEGISVVTLSVSTSKSGSSAFTASPTFVYQLATVPSVTVSPSCGMITSIPALSCRLLCRAARFERAANIGNDARDRRHDGVLELVGGGQGHVRRGDPDDRSLERAENLLLDDRGDFRAPAAQPRILLDREYAPGSRRVREQRLRVERHERAHVDHRRGDAVLAGEHFRRLQRARNHGGERDHRDVLPFAQHLRFSERLDVLALGHLALVGEQALVLEEHHRIGIAYCRGEQSLRAGRRGRRDDLQARYRHRPVLDTLRMLRAETRSRPVRRADHERNRDLPVAHVARLGDLVRDIIPAAGEKIREHDLGDG